MKLTKLQRYTAYCILLEEAEENYEHCPGFCALLRQQLDINILISKEIGYPTFKKIFPELHSKATRNEYDFVMLFNNWEERFSALEQCIAETHP